MSLSAEAITLIKDIEYFEMSQQAQRRSKEMLETSVKDYQSKLATVEENLEIVSNATSLLQKVSASSVDRSYRFIEENVNTALERIFPDKVRKIHLEETQLKGYPQLELSLLVEGGEKRSISDGSGHGIAQIISLLCDFCLIVIRNCRRLVILDEVISGLDIESRGIFEQIMWDFSTIGFQFILVEHASIPPVGAYVVRFDKGKKGTEVKEAYIQQAGNGDTEWDSYRDTEQYEVAGATGITDLHSK